MTTGRCDATVSRTGFQNIHASRNALSESAMTPDKPRDGAWFALVDTEGCRLLKCDLTRRGTHRVREVATFENRWPKHRRGRPMALGGMTGDSYASPHHHTAERIRRCAQGVVKQLRAECKQRRIVSLTIIAPPRLLGELRKLCESQNGDFALCEGELMQFSTAALAVHPVIRGLVGA
jgi:protein required for attachment to host cells